MLIFQYGSRMIGHDEKLFEFSRYCKWDIFKVQGSKVTGENIDKIIGMVWCVLYIGKYTPFYRRYIGLCLLERKKMKRRK